MFYYFCRQLVWYFLRIVYRIKVEGVENIPANGPLIIASNHASFWDPPVIGAATPRPIYFMAKEQLFRNFLFGWLIKKLHAFPVKRDIFSVPVFRKSLDLLNKGEILLIFPEGTRSKGPFLSSPSPGVGMLAFLGKVKVVPTLVINTYKSFSFAQMRVRFGKPLYFSNFEKENKSRKEVYQEISKKIMQEIKNLDYENNFQWK